MKLHRSAVLSVLLFCACAPSFEHMAAQGTGEEWGQTSQSGQDEDEANMAALRELMARAQGDDAPVVMVADGRMSTPTLPEGMPVLPLVVTAPQSALTSEGELRRSAVVSFWQRGPHALLGAAELVPGRIDGRLLGLQLQTIHESGEFLMAAGLLPGDIIMSINGEGVISPDQFMRVWDSLPEAESLSIQLQRGEHAQTLQWPIVDDSEVAAHAE